MYTRVILSYVPVCAALKANWALIFMWGWIYKHQIRNSGEHFKCEPKKGPKELKFYQKKMLDPAQRAQL